MNYGKAIEICTYLDFEQFGERDVLAAVEKILSMPTINAVPKVALLNVVRYFWNKCVEESQPEHGNCPLHGRLIDADALARQENQAHEETLWTCEDEWKKAVYSAMHRYFQALIADAPTVVEPEEEVETP